MTIHLAVCQIAFMLAFAHLRNDVSQVFQTLSGDN